MRTIKNLWDSCKIDAKIFKMSTIIKLPLPKVYREDQ